MNKKTIWIIVAVGVLILATVGFYFKEALFSNYQTIIRGTETQSGSIDELITKNYKPQFHHLDLRSKKLDKMPDICGMVTGTSYEFDIWAVDLADNGIAEIDQDLSCLQNLGELYLSFNKISEIQNLDTLIFLKKLDLGNNEIQHISGLEKLTNLSDLHLGYNQITSTAGLEKLTNLISLQLQSNKLEDISNLTNLTKLQTLKMEFNKLDTEDIKIIEKLKDIKIITVGENPGIDMKVIEKLNEFTRKNMDTK